MNLSEKYRLARTATGSGREAYYAEDVEYVIAQLEEELADFRDRRDEKLQEYEDCKKENEVLRKKYIDALRIMELTMKRMAEVAHDTKEDIAFLREEPPCP